MGNYRYNWEGEFVKFTTRHLPKVIHQRLKLMSINTEESIERVVNKALDLGLQQMERQEQ